LSWSIDGKPINSLLISRLRYLGDVVMSTILLEVLRKGAPDLDIGYLCESAHGAVLINHPCINRLHLLGVQRSNADAQSRSSGESMSGRSQTSHGTLATVFKLKKQGYDAAVDLFFNPRSAWLIRFAGSGVRICGDAGSRRKLFTHSVIRQEFGQASDPSPHNILKSLAPGGLGEHLCRLAPLHHEPSGLDFVHWLEQNYPTGSLRPSIAPAVVSDKAKEDLHSHGVSLGEPYIVAAPTATWDSKMMPVSIWRETLAQLAGATGMKILVVTAPGSRILFESLRDTSLSSGITVLEPMKLPDVLGLIQGAKALLSVDGGIMHAAVAMGVPTVGLFGPTDPEMWFPYEGLGPYQVLAAKPHCSPCHLHHCNDFICMPQLQVPDMIMAVQEVLKMGSQREIN
jgi:ADP-heptose:LPS heptosyltransferase